MNQKKNIRSLEGRRFKFSLLVLAAIVILSAATRGKMGLAEDLDLPDLPSDEPVIESSSPSATEEDQALKELEQAVAEDSAANRETSTAAAAPKVAAEVPANDPVHHVSTQTQMGGGSVNPTNSAPTIPAYRNEITNVEFKMAGVNSRVVLTFKRRPVHREIKNAQMRQVVYFFDNAVTPQKLQRAFDTSEFLSPVALFTVLQMPGETPPLSKLILQLREDSTPMVSVSDRAMQIEFPPPSKKAEEPRLVAAEDPNKSTEENIYSGAQVYTGKVIKRLEIKNSDVQDVLRLIARTSGYNVVVGEDVTGKVGTLSLENIPWDQAFALVLQSKKLGYIRQGGVLRVGTLATLKAEKEEALANEQSRMRVEPLKTVLIPISYARAADISPRAKTFSSERGSVDVDDRTNTVILRDVSSVIERVQKLISALDVQPPRVSISGKVVEMSSSFTRDVGLNNVTFTDNLAGINFVNFFSTSSSTGSASSTISAPRFANLSAQLALGELDSMVKVLANPSVSVVANQSASINSNIQLNRPVPGTPASGTTPATPGGYATFTATLSLAVTPIVSGDGSIFLNVQVSNDTLVPGPTDVTVNTRSMNTQVLLENGDTAVIGGLFQSNVSTSRSGIAYLMRVPILGFLFGGSNFSDVSTEVFVFLTAKIMNAEEAFRRNF